MVQILCLMGSLDGVLHGYTGRREEKERTRKFKLGVIGRIVSGNGATLNCMENVRDMKGEYIPLSFKVDTDENLFCACIGGIASW